MGMTSSILFLSYSRLEDTKLINISQARRDLRRQVRYEESNEESHPRCQHQEGRGDNHGAGGTDGVETAK